MRATYLLLTASILPATGCTALLVGSGTNLADLKTQDQVQEAFRQPTATGQADRQRFEEYTTRRKIAEPNKVIYAVMGTYATFGFGELVWFPTELYRSIRRSVVGQRLRFTYDAAGNVTAIDFDGEAVRLPPRTEPTPTEN